MSGKAMLTTVESMPAMPEPSTHARTIQRPFAVDSRTAGSDPVIVTPRPPRRSPGNYDVTACAASLTLTGSCRSNWLLSEARPAASTNRPSEADAVEHATVEDGSSF